MQNYLKKIGFMCRWAVADAYFSSSTLKIKIEARALSERDVTRALVKQLRRTQY